MLNYQFIRKDPKQYAILKYGEITSTNTCGITAYSWSWMEKETWSTLIPDLTGYFNLPWEEGDLFWLFREVVFEIPAKFRRKEYYIRSLPSYSDFVCGYRCHVILTIFHIIQWTKRHFHRSIYHPECSKYEKFHKNLLQTHEIWDHELANFYKQMYACPLAQVRLLILKLASFVRQIYWDCVTNKRLDRVRFRNFSSVQSSL